MVMAHQTPFKPSPFPSNIAKGIRAAVKVTDIIEGGNVLPKPLKAPAVVIYIHINNWEKPKIRK